MSTIDFDHPPADPVGACKAWFIESEGMGFANPTAMTLAAQVASRSAGATSRLKRLLTSTANLL
jgi:hypothetical protein